VHERVGVLAVPKRVLGRIADDDVVTVGGVGRVRYSYFVALGVDGFSSLGYLGVTSESHQGAGPFKQSVT
jgi:hypothetical protein